MSQFEMLYGRTCRTPICWGKMRQRVIGSTKMVQKSTEKIHHIGERLQAAQS